MSDAPEPPSSANSTSSPTRRSRRNTLSPRLEQGLNQDDSFSDERFLPAGSWESQSFDSEEPMAGGRSSRPSSRTSLRDRRKQFDLTTPTLIDEEDEPEEGVEQEMLSLEHHHRAAQVFDDEDKLRRTPGASMYKSSYEDIANMRRTPGASSMHRSGSQGTKEVDAASLGFALTLSTPVNEGQTETSKSTMWERSSAANPELVHEEKMRPPLAPPPSGASVASGTAASTRTQAEPRGPFSIAPWTRPTAQSMVSSSEGTRTGAFSPTTLRLSEDLGNLLQEDEDDDYAFEIPSAFRGSTDSGNSDFNTDWTGSYVFDSSTGSRSKPGVPRNYTSQGKTRRRSGHGSFLSHAQQPKPRRSGNEGFEFGNTTISGATRADERASPQLINFGGAFAPLPNHGSFMRPVASSAGCGVNYESAPSLEPAFGEPQGGFQTVTSAAVGHLQSHSFEIHQQGLDIHQQGLGTADTPFFGSVQQRTRYSPNPMFFVPAGSQQQMSAIHPSEMQHMSALHPSEMQANAREFVPMSTRGATPQFVSLPWTQQAPAVHYDPQPIEPGTWHAAQNFRFMDFGYPLPSQSFADTRGSMSPSPHFTTWQPPPSAPLPQVHDSNSLFGGIQHMSRVEMQQQPTQPPTLPAMYARATLTPTPTHSQHSSASLEHREQALRRRDTTKRGKRGKKKSQKEKPEPVNLEKKTTSVKKKGKGDLVRPESATPSQVGNTDEGAFSVSEDPVDARRAELVESPATRVAFKEFYRSFRIEEKYSFQKAEEFAMQAVEAGMVPDTVHWRVYLELADLAKRANRFAEARRLYQKVCQLQPYAFQGWLEYSKLEEECGHLNRVMNILHAGLEYCAHNETLMTRAVKLQEKMGNLDMARALLARLKHVGIHKVWKTVLEGALVEARAGNVATARRVLKYLMHHVPWYGPLYLEAYRLERDQQHTQEALQVVERGLAAIPRYGPLWFGAMRLCEEIDTANQAYDLTMTIEMIERATASISKELVWKVHLEAAQMHERAALLQASVDDPEFDHLLDLARRRLALTVLTCPHNLRWKVWLAAARTELGFGNTRRARDLFLRAHQVVPEKGRSSTLLECARLEEFLGDTDLARAILCRGRRDYGHDWKVWLESVLLEIRDRQFSRAIEICACALELHSGTGRLWACLVQLQQSNGGDRAQNVALRLALNAVPKSGEVWCEGGRMHLNPFSATFDLDRARRHLYFATKFTPQYGDSFVEGIRLEVVDQWLSPVSEFIWEKTCSSFQPTQVDDQERLTKYLTSVVRIIFIACCLETEADIPIEVQFPEIISSLHELLKPDNLRRCTDLSDLRLACANADPNYGSLWFYCRRGASDPPRKVIEHAAELVAADVQTCAHIYLAAMVRRRAILAMANLARPSSFRKGEIEITDPDLIQWENQVDEKLLAFICLEDVLRLVDPATGQGESWNGSLFVSGLTVLNKHQSVSSMTLVERKNALFGNDALFP